MNHFEDALQMACHQWLDLMQIPHHHSPNGGKRNVREAARLKAMGVSAGFPDFIILIKKHVIVFIELKYGRNTLTEAQKEWKQIIITMGWPWYECRSFEEFQQIVNSYR